MALKQLMLMRKLEQRKAELAEIEKREAEIRFHRNGASQHLVLGMFVSACWIAAVVVILQRVQ